MKAIAPLIPDSTSFNSNYTRNLKCSKIISNLITNGTVSITNGIISGISNPVNNSDAANKQWSDLNMPGGIAALPLNSIQYSNMNLFTGSSTLTYTVDTSTLYSTKTSVDGIYITTGSITGINNPVNNTDAVNKQYTDNFFKINRLTISNAAGVTYSSMANIIVSRDTLGNSVSDTTANAADIITEMNNISSVSFKVRNINTDYDSILNISPGTDVIIKPTNGSLNIWPGYEFNSVITTDGTSAYINVIGINFYNTNNNFTIGNRGLNVSSNITKIVDQFSFNTDINNLTTKNVIYNPTNIGGIIYRNYEGDKIDTFGNVSSFINGFAFPNSQIDYLFTTGAIELIIKNTSSTGAVYLTETTGWTFDENSNMTIDSGKTGIFYLYINTTNITGNVYTIGIV